jgi:hypothetical protein
MVRTHYSGGIFGPNDFLRGERLAAGVDEVVTHYNEERNHQGFANQPE